MKRFYLLAGINWIILASLIIVACTVNHIACVGGEGSGAGLTECHINDEETKHLPSLLDNRKELHIKDVLTNESVVIDRE